MAIISASILHDFLECPHRVTMDALGAARLKDPVSPFMQLLWDQGTSVEKQCVESLGTPFLDLSPLRGEQKEVQTRSAIQRGEALIYGGRLSDAELLGEPDLLRREGTGYVAIDIKSGPAELPGSDDDAEAKPKKAYGVQLALYTDLLERAGASSGRYGYIRDVHGKEVRYEFDAPLGPRSASIAIAYRELKAAAARALDRESATRPALSAACRLCVWKSNCLRELRAEGDLTLLPRVGRAKRDALVGAFPTVEWLASADLSRYAKSKKPPFPGISAPMLVRLQVRARLAVATNPAPFFREAVQLPTNPHEVFFDIEDDPMRGLVYLHGFVVRTHGDPSDERLVSVFAEHATEQGERDAFAAAWSFLSRHADHIVYYYSKHERTKYRALQAKYPRVCSAADVEALFSPRRSYDLYDDAVAKSEWPTLDWSIKSLATFLGFRWRDSDPSGAASIEWFDHWVRTHDAATKQRILDYNEDDCRAMRVLLDAMRSMPQNPG